jgi:hypothetical protein
MKPRNDGWVIVKAEPETKKKSKPKPVSMIAKSWQQEFEEALARQLRPENLEPMLKRALRKASPEAQRIFGTGWRQEHAKVTKATETSGETGHDLGGQGVGLLVETRDGERRIGGGKLTKSADEKRANFGNVLTQKTWNGVSYDD